MVLRVQKKGRLTKQDIEEKIANAGDYVKIDHLTRFLQEPLEQDVRRFALLTLAGLYSSKLMFPEAGKLMRLAGDLQVTFKEKIDSYVKSGELFMKANLFSESDNSFVKALECGNNKEKEEIKNIRKTLYFSLAKEYLSRNKRGNASQVYEKILTLDLSPEELIEAKKTLLVLYEQLGKIREFSMLQRSIDSAELQKKQHQEAIETQKQKYSPSVDELIGL
ncbi:MAG: hypothetical protein AABX65_00205 [Nanoarchaeota archaeon]